jgi:LPXTG-motif cell wall-anchored protein|nr:flagellar biosynthetic protein FliO [Kofleriaceae bacterium]
MLKRVVLWAFAVMVPAVASAEPRFEVIDRGDAIEVIGHDIMTARTTITAARSRLEIPLAAGAMPVAKRVDLKNDATMLLAEIDPDAHAVSVKLTMDHAGVVAIAKASQAMQIGDDIHVLVPRKPEGVVLPEPTLAVVVKPQAEADKAKTAETEKTAETVASPSPSPSPSMSTTTTTSTVPATSVAGIPTVKDDAKPIASATADDGGTPMATYIGGGLLAIAAGVWLWRRKKKPAMPQTTIDVIAQRSLGGKAKIVWLGAGGRELLVAVTPNNVRLLGDWPRGEAPATAQIATAAHPQIPMARTTTATDIKSPAVTGILKLRERASTAVNAEVATDDVEADATWARELLAATGRR